MPTIDPRPAPLDAYRLFASTELDEAREMVLGAYGRFSPKMAEIAGDFFDKNWIDAPARPGKAPPPDWFQTLQDMDKIPNGLRSVGFSEEEVDKIIHANWLRLYRATFRQPDS